MRYLHKKWQKRAILISITLGFFAVALALILKVFNENIIFFYTPRELTPQIRALPHNVRLGGIVKPDSVDFDERTLTLRFILTDLVAEIPVHYHGLPPNLFRAKQGTVVLGKFTDGVFIATELLAKHDENYMPKEIADKLHLTTPSLKGKDA